jgi:uncharacterized protein YegL
MTGQPIEAVRQGVKYLVSELKQEPHALETAYLGVITFSSTAQQVSPLTDITTFREPQIEAEGGTALGAALTLLDKCLEREIRKNTPQQKGDYKPMVFLLTDGEPTDSWEAPADQIKNKTRKFANIITVGCGPSVNTETLKKISDVVLMMNSFKPEDFKQFFKWVSQSVVSASKEFAKNPTAPANLPPPPPSIQIQP